MYWCFIECIEPYGMFIWINAVDWLCNDEIAGKNKRVSINWAEDCYRAIWFSIHSTVDSLYSLYSPFYIRMDTYWQNGSVQTIYTQKKDLCFKLRAIHWKCFDNTHTHTKKPPQTVCLLSGYDFESSFISKYRSIEQFQAKEFRLWHLFRWSNA